MTNEEKILQTVEGVSEQLEFVAQRMNVVEDKVDKLVSNQHRDILRWFEFDTKMHDIITAKDFRIMRDEIMNSQDKIMGLMQHLDEERLSMVSRMDRMESTIGEQKIKISKQEIVLKDLQTSMGV